MLHGYSTRPSMLEEVLRQWHRFLVRKRNAQIIWLQRLLFWRQSILAMDGNLDVLGDHVPVPQTPDVLDGICSRSGESAHMPVDILELGCTFPMEVAQAGGSTTASESKLHKVRLEIVQCAVFFRAAVLVIFLKSLTLV